jgi:formyl-CoA transferase
VRSGPALADFSGGVHLFGAIATALFQRERTGRGTFIDVAMLETVYPMLASNLGSLYSNQGNAPERMGNRHGGLSLCPYNVYPTSDGYIAIISNSDRHWDALLQAMGREDLLGDERYATTPKRVGRMEEVDALVADWSGQHERDSLYALLVAHRVPCAPVRDLRELVEDPHLHERGMLLEVEHPKLGPITVCRSPLRFEGSPPPEYQLSPAYGADTAGVLREKLQLSDADVEALASQGALT